jgi:hypothetical protein
MRYELVPFTHDHLKRIVPRESDRHFMYLWGWLKEDDPRFRLYTWLEGETVIGIGGLMLNEDGGATGALVLSEDYRRVPVGFTLKVMREMNRLVKELHLQYVEAYVDHKHLFERLPWLTRLGFTKARTIQEHVQWTCLVRESD